MGNGCLHSLQYSICGACFEYHIIDHNNTNDARIKKIVKNII